MCKFIVFTYLFAALFFFRTAYSQVDISLLETGIVKINSTDIDGNKKTGTGFVIKQENNTLTILTVTHVIEGDQSPLVFLRSEPQQAVPAKIIRMEKDLNGLAILSVTLEKKTPVYTLQYALDQNVLKGTKVSTIGFPRISNIAWAFSSGFIQGIDGKTIVFSMNVEEGNSGGPLLDENGNVIGLITSKSSAGAALKKSYIDTVLSGWGMSLLETTTRPNFIKQIFTDYYLYYPKKDNLFLNPKGNWLAPCFYRADEDRFPATKFCVLELTRKGEWIGKTKLRSSGMQIKNYEWRNSSLCFSAKQLDGIDSTLHFYDLAGSLNWSARLSNTITLQDFFLDTESNVWVLYDETVQSQTMTHRVAGKFSKNGEQTVRVVLQSLNNKINIKQPCRIVPLSGKKYAVLYSTESNTSFFYLDDSGFLASNKVVLSDDAMTAVQISPDYQNIWILTHKQNLVRLNASAKVVWKEALSDYDGPESIYLTADSEKIFVQSDKYLLTISSNKITSEITLTKNMVLNSIVAGENNTVFAAGSQSISNKVYATVLKWNGNSQSLWEKTFEQDGLESTCKSMSYDSLSQSISLFGLGAQTIENGTVKDALWFIRLDKDGIPLD